MSDPGAATSRTERAAESALLKLVARCAMVVTLPIGGYIGAMVLTKVDRASESTARLEEKVTLLLTQQLPEMRRRSDKQDADLDELKRRVYALPPRSTP